MCKFPRISYRLFCLNEGPKQIQYHICIFNLSLTYNSPINYFYIYSLLYIIYLLNKPHKFKSFHSTNTFKLRKTRPSCHLWLPFIEHLLLFRIELRLYIYLSFQSYLKTNKRFTAH